MSRHFHLILNPNPEPLIPENDNSIKKLYSYNNKTGDHLVSIRQDKVSFHRYDVPELYALAATIDFEERYGHPYPSVEEMEFELPETAMTTFIYD